MKIAERMHGIPRIGLDIMGDLADSRDLAAKSGQTYRLENADSNIQPPDIATSSTKDAVGRDEYNSWLPLVGLGELRSLVCERIKREDHLNYDWRSEIIITNGVQEGLLSTFLALLNPGDGVITPEPAYSGIINRIRLAHGIPQFVSLNEDKGWKLDLQELERRVEPSTKMIVFNSTNMPTGITYTRDELDFIADLAVQRDLWVVYDAPTSHLTFHMDRALNIASWPGMRERTIILDGVSKDFNMTAWRIGWAVADKPVIEHIGKAHMYNGTLTSAFAQAGVIELLKNPIAVDTYTKNCVRILSERAEVASTGLNAISGLTCVPPDGGWWFLVDHREIDSDDESFSHYLLDEANVAVTPMGTWGPATAVGHFRVIFANESVERLREAVDRIKQALGKRMG